MRRVETVVRINHADRRGELATDAQESLFWHAVFASYVFASQSTEIKLFCDAKYDEVQGEYKSECSTYAKHESGRKGPVGARNDTS